MPASPRTRAADAEPGGDSAFEPSVLEPEPRRGTSPRAPAAGRLGWAVVLLGIAAIFWAGRWLASTPEIDARWAAGADHALVLIDSPLPALQVHRGRILQSVGGEGVAPMPVDAVVLDRAPRWQVNEPLRALHSAQQRGLAERLATGSVQLHFDDGAVVAVPALARGWAGVGWAFWPLAGLALLLALAAATVLSRRRHRLDLLYAMMAACQAVQLLLMALGSARGLVVPGGLWADDPMLRIALDGATGAAAVTAFAHHPRRVPGAGLVAAVAWVGVLLWLGLARAGLLVPLWWWAQGLALALTAAALAMAAWSYRLEPDPRSLVVRRLATAALATLALLTAALALASRTGQPGSAAVLGAATAWQIFLASLLLLTPFLARSRRVQREFVLLTGAGTLAMSLHLLLAAAFSLPEQATLPLALGGALVLYAAARQWLSEHIVGRSALSIEKIFERLYRAAREAQAQPDRHPQLLERLLRELFEPLEVAAADRVPERARVLGGGAALVVPVRGAEVDAAATRAIVLRHAQQGQRLFTFDDARLVDRLAEQMRRAVAYDLAVERGRHEERLRIAQDLHDDIGARLLTLMYQAPTPELEDYIRHTLQDLKTLTRGLAAAEHRLSHAAVEWKADLSHRLAAAQAELAWSFQSDRDLHLTVVQWSALTRVLRELVSNALYHGHATAVEVLIQLERGQLLLRVADDGGGRDPASWAHGLGLGGVRKRVKLLGGEVRWTENRPCGIVCEVRVAGFQGRA